MKINLQNRWLNAFIIGGCFVFAGLVGIGVFYLNEETYYDFRRSFRIIPDNTFLAECTVKECLDDVYPEGSQHLASHWLISGEGDDGKVDSYPLNIGWEYSSLLTPYQSSPQKWRPVSQLQLRKEWGIGSDQYRTIFEDKTLKCEAMLRDVNDNGSLDIVLRKSQTLVGNDESATDVTVCAYEIVDGRVQFFEP